MKKLTYATVITKAKVAAFAKAKEVKNVNIDPGKKTIQVSFIKFTLYYNWETHSFAYTA